MIMFNTTFYKDFFKKELKENLLSFWMPRCLDKENGGYLNCFCNDGSRLISTDKYTWSQGRFLWIFSKLATASVDIFSDDERKTFLKYAKNGRDFLIKNVLIAENDYRCVFLMNANGTPKYVDGYSELDMSISADCFVIMGFAKYAVAANDRESYEFAKKLYQSVWTRYNSDNYKSLPYPVSPQYISHARPMILTNVTSEIYYASLIFDTDFTKTLKKNLSECSDEIFNIFCDNNNLVHEFKYKDGDFPKNLFGQHINPGHTLEDMWFQIEAQDILNCNKYDEKIQKIVEQTMSTGWDQLYGGIYHFITCDGLGMNGDTGDAKDEPQMKLVIDDWGSKLWWVHSEALYTTLLMYLKTKKQAFYDMFVSVFNYTYKTFPNPDRDIREWIQIRTRDGSPQEKVVALPVKDPYHIIRNVILILEILEKHK